MRDVLIGLALALPFVAWADGRRRLGNVYDEIEEAIVLAFIEQSNRHRYLAWTHPDAARFETRGMPR